jgi:hypothetical protein
VTGYVNAEREREGGGERREKEIRRAKRRNRETAGCSSGNGYRVTPSTYLIHLSFPSALAAISLLARLGSPTHD